MSNRSVFKDKTLLITGGTGSFGNAVLRGFLDSEIAEIRIFSRDEKKQYDMALSYRQYSNLRFEIGDVRDLERTRDALRGIDIVYNAAALKQVPSCEYSPYEAVETNIIGANNVRRAAIEAGPYVEMFRKKDIEIIHVKRMDELLPLVLTEMPVLRGTMAEAVTPPPASVSHVTQ